MAHARWLAACWVLLVAHVHAADKGPNAGASEAKQAVAKLPLDRIAGPHRDAVLAILERPLFYRKGPVEAFPCQPGLMEWLLEHPIWAAELWRQMGIDVSPVRPIDDGYECKEGDRVTVEFHVVHRSDEMRIVYCVGEARRPPIPGKLRAEMVLVHRYRFVQDPKGQFHVVQQVEGFVSAKGATLKAILKVARATSEQVVDQCLQEIMVYFSVLCRLVQVRPQWTLAAIDRLRARLPTPEADELESMVLKLPSISSSTSGLPRAIIEPYSEGATQPRTNEQSALAQ